MSTATQFALTAAEQAFIDHFSRERCDAQPGPAHSWMRQHNLDYGYMDIFQYWCERNDPEFLTRVVVRENPLPEFEVPWTSKEEMVARAKDIVDIYPRAGDWLPRG